MAVGKRKQLKLKQPQRGSIDVKCPKLDELNGNSVPFCSHGELVFFSPVSISFAWSISFSF